MRVAVVNDFEVIVRGVAALLADQPDVEVVELAVDEPVDVAIDVALFDTFGSDRLQADLLLRVIANPHVAAVAAYTTRADDELRRRVLELGARGYLSKALPGEELADAIRRIAAGEVVVTDRADADDGILAQGAWPGQEHGLSEREADTLALLARGMENEEIARQLYVSANTVKARLKSIYRKIEAGNRVQAALWAVRNGFEPDRQVDWSSGG